MVSSLTATIQRRFDHAFANANWKRRRIDTYCYESSSARLTLIHEKLRGQAVVETNPILAIDNEDIEALYRSIVGKRAPGPAAFACNLGYLVGGRYLRWRFTEGRCDHEIGEFMSVVRRVVVPIAERTRDTPGLCRFISDREDRGGTNHAGPVKIALAKHLFGGAVMVSDFFCSTMAAIRRCEPDAFPIQMLRFFVKYRNYVGRDHFDP